MLGTRSAAAYMPVTAAHLGSRASATTTQYSPLSYAQALLGSCSDVLLSALRSVMGLEMPILASAENMPHDEPSQRWYVMILMSWPPCASLASHETSYAGPREGMRGNHESSTACQTGIQQDCRLRAWPATRLMQY